MTKEEFVNNLERLRFEYNHIVGPVVKYLNRELSIDQLPPSEFDIRNRDDANIYIESLKGLGNYQRMQSYYFLHV